MPSAQKRRIVEKTRGRQSRGRVYLVALVLLIIIVGVAWYAYSVVTAPKPDFTVSAPTGVTIRAGNPTASTVTVTFVNQFSGTVSLTVKGSTGLNATITPSNVTSTGTAKLITSAASNGSYTVTITATSGSLVHTVAPRIATPIFATLVTPNGTMYVELYRAQAPQTVANFVNLVQSGFYNNLTWHRIVKGFVIQTGDPNTYNGLGNNNTWGQGHSQQTVPLEIDSSLRNDASYLAMARFGTDLNSGSSQFYINLADNNNLNGNYTVFGKVTQGMDVALKLGNVPVYPGSDQPIKPVFLTKVIIN